MSGLSIGNGLSKGGGLSAGSGLSRGGGLYFGGFSAQPSFILDQISAPSAAAYSLRKLREAYSGSAIIVRRSSDNTTANIGFATAIQTRTNLAAIPINNNGGATLPGVTMTVTGTGTEFGQPYVEVRWQGTATINGFIQFVHSATAAFNPAIHAPVTPGLTYTISVGFRLVSGTAPSGTPAMRGRQIASGGGLITGGTGINIGALSSELQRHAVIVVAVANAAYIQPNILMSVNNGEVVNVTIRFYTANVEQAVGNARPLLQRNVPEVVAAIGDLDMNALLTFVGNGNGFVTTWYDQSGNGRNATQATAGGQPRIVTNGAIETQNGRPMPRFDGNDSLSFQGVHDAQWSLAVVGRAAGTNQGFVQFGGVNQFGSMFVESGTYRARPTGFLNATAPFTAGEIAVLTATYGATQTNIWKNGAIGTPTAEGGVASNAGSFIGRLGEAFPLDGNIGEIIALNGVLSTTDRQTLERNQGAYYSIPVA